MKPQIAEDELQMLEKLTTKPKTIYHRAIIKKLVEEIRAYKSQVEEMQKTLQLAKNRIEIGNPSSALLLISVTLQSLKEDKPNETTI